MNTYNDIRTRNNLLHYLDRCIFLIDHDYEGALSSKVVVPETLRDNLTITKLYSFENYFLIEENIDKIFKLFGLDDVNVFKQKLNNFVEEIREYNRLKSAINISYMKGVNYRPPVNYRKNMILMKFLFSILIMYMITILEKNYSIENLII